MKIQDIHDDSGESSETQGVKIQDIHDDRVEVPGHRGGDSGHSRGWSESSGKSGVKIQDIHDDSGESSETQGWKFWEVRSDCPEYRVKIPKDKAELFK